MSPAARPPARYDTLQEMLSAYFYPGEEEIDPPAGLARRLKADNPPAWIARLRADIARFLTDAGADAEAWFSRTLVSYFHPDDEGVAAWLTALDAALSGED